MNIEAYTSRIGYTGSLTPSLEVLKDLQKKHLLNVPFENLDIHNKVPIDLDFDDFYVKIVEKRRGGFCYELNGLFYKLLQVLGFDTRIISARAYNNKKDKFGEEYDHLALLVEFDQTDYLVDVGFGEFAFFPLKLETSTIQIDPRGNFVIEKHDSNYLKVSKIVEEKKAVEYIFSTKEKALSEFRGMSIYHQTSPNSHFTQKRLISMPTEMGRITLTGNTLKITEGSSLVLEQNFENEEFEKYLWNYFKYR